MGDRVVCCRCLRSETPRDRLKKCNSRTCQSFIHDGCLRQEEGELVNGEIIWVCNTHQRNREPVNTRRQNNRRNNNDPVTTPARRNEQESEEREHSRLANGSTHGSALLINSTQHEIPQRSILDAEVGDNDRRDPLIPAPINSDELPVCEECEIEIADNPVECLGCKSTYHYNCLLNDEQVAANRKQFLCASCLAITENVNRARNRPGRESNLENESVRNQQGITRRQSREEFGQQQHNNIHQENRFMNHFVSSSNNVNHRRSRRPNFSPFSNREIEVRQLNERTSYRDRPSEVSFLTESYIEMMKKMSLKDLPEVTENSLSWTSFFSSYMNSRLLFEDQENIVRIQRAIKDKEVLRIGGHKLFLVATYHEAILNINERLDRDREFINKLAFELRKSPKMRSDAYKKIIEFIDKIVDFERLASHFGDLSYVMNINFIDKIADKFPMLIYNKWINKVTQAERMRQQVQLKDFVDELKNEIPILQNKLRLANQRITDGREIKTRESRTYNMNLENESELKNRVVFDDKFCWLHKNVLHPSHKCRNLWKLSGKEVAELAVKNDRCIVCGQEKHSDCPFRESLRCIIDGCKIKHHMLYCEKRPAGWKKHEDIEAKNNCHQHTSRLDYEPQEISRMANLLNDELDIDMNTSKIVEMRKEDENESTEFYTSTTNYLRYENVDNQFYSFVTSNNTTNDVTIENHLSEESNLSLKSIKSAKRLINEKCVCKDESVIHLNNQINTEEMSKNLMAKYRLTIKKNKSKLKRYHTKIGNYKRLISNALKYFSIDNARNVNKVQKKCYQYKDNSSLETENNSQRLNASKPCEDNNESVELRLERNTLYENQKLEIEKSLNQKKKAKVLQRNKKKNAKSFLLSSQVEVFKKKIGESVNTFIEEKKSTRLSKRSKRQKRKRVRSSIWRLILQKFSFYIIMIGQITLEASKMSFSLQDVKIRIKNVYLCFVRMIKTFWTYMRNLIKHLVKIKLRKDFFAHVEKIKIDQEKLLNLDDDAKIKLFLNRDDEKIIASILTQKSELKTKEISLKDIQLHLDDMINLVQRWKFYQSD